MILVQIESVDDLENNRHLDRSMELTRFSFHRTDHSILEGLLSFNMFLYDQYDEGQKNSFELVAAVPLRIATKSDPEWTFASGERGEMQVGRSYIANNYIPLWIRDQEARPIAEVTQIFLEDFAPICKAGFVPPFDESSKEKRREVLRYLSERVRDGCAMNLLSTRHELRDLSTSIMGLVKKREIFDQMLIWNSPRHD